MTPFPVPHPRPRSEDQRLWFQALRCLMAASWQRAIFASVPVGTNGLVVDEGIAWNALVHSEELIEGATVYLQLRADLRERAPS